MDELIKKNGKRVQNFGTYYWIAVNQDNGIMIYKDDGFIEFYLDDDLLEDHLSEMYYDTFKKDIFQFSKWVVEEYSDDDVEGFFDEADYYQDKYNPSSSVKVKGKAKTKAKKKIVNESNKDYLYESLRNDIDSDRELNIYSYGKKHRKRLPPQMKCQANFNACILSGRRAGLNLKKLNGLSLDVQKSVETSKNFDTFLSMIVKKIEKDNLTSIAIYCSAGRHRSVTCCEILKKKLYPKSKVYHVELKKHT